MALIVLSRIFYRSPVAFAGHCHDFGAFTASNGVFMTKAQKRDEKDMQTLDFIKSNKIK